MWLFFGGFAKPMKCGLDIYVFLLAYKRYSFNGKLKTLFSVTKYVFMFQIKTIQFVCHYLLLLFGVHGGVNLANGKASQADVSNNEVTINVAFLSELPIIFA